MDDLISRKALLNDLCYCAPELWHDEEYIRAKIEKQPAVDAVPVVHAHWRTVKDGSLECTNCFAQSPHDENYYGDIICNYETEYCPCCGAKMDG